MVEAVEITYEMPHGYDKHVSLTGKVTATQAYLWVFMNIDTNRQEDKVGIARQTHYSRKTFDLLEHRLFKLI